MPRIPREAHATIRHRVDVEGQKVAEVAAAYGCTPANIYAILARLRRQGAQDADDVLPSASTAEPAPPPCRRSPLQATSSADWPRQGRAAPSVAERGVGLQQRRHDPHAGDTRLPAAAEDEANPSQPRLLLTEHGGYKLDATIPANSAA